MAGISFFELLIIFLIGLIVLGPERLPRVASQLGTWLGQARRMTRVMKRQLEEELNLEKEFSIHPGTRPRNPALPASKPAPAPAPAPADEQDDTWSAAHGPDSPGTGVGDGEEPAPGTTNGGDREGDANPGEAARAADDAASDPKA